MKKELLSVRLDALREPSYGSFLAKLQVSDRAILGVRTKHLDALAKELAKTEGIDALEDLLKDPHIPYEHIIILYKLYGQLRLGDAKRLSYLDKLRTYNHSWATNDTLASSLKAAQATPTLYHGYFKNLLTENNPFDQRLGIVCFMLYFLKEPTFPETLQLLQAVHTDDYYVIMALGWAYATAFCKNRELTLPYLGKGCLDERVRKKAIQKCRESRLVSRADKTLLASLS